ncbi:hypothetical protein [Aeromonas veronii]|uniref:hypothetical protein n=1 Tax=Aeromonas veronii TaxID=654 RepID=UPI003D1A6BDD
MCKLFLKKNRIYFEIISSLLLGVMAILVSYQSNVIAESQLKIDESQLQVDQAQLQVANHAIQLQEQEQLPDVKAKIRTVIDENGDVSDSVEILNTGKDLYDLNSSIVAFLSVRELQVINGNTPPKQVPRLINAFIPIYNYPENFIIVEDPNNGKMSTIQIKSTRKLDQTFEEFKTTHETKSRSVVSFIEKYIYISYKDKFGLKHSKYYQFGPGGDSIPMDNTSGEDIFKMHQLGIKHQKYIDMENIDKNTLDRLWVDYGRNVVTGNSIYNNS